MRNSTESPISLGERFLIRDAVDLSRPILANVFIAKNIENENGIWQKVGLKRLIPPQSSLELCTYRRLACGVYTNRDNRFTFLRFSTLEIEEMSEFFDMNPKQLISTLTRDICSISPQYLINQTVMAARARVMFDSARQQFGR